MSVPGDRLILFELAGQVFALPIAEVAEVSELGRISAVPTLPLTAGGIMNHHGDALPVIESRALLGIAGEERPVEHVLVLGREEEDAQRLGLPVERVLGLVDGSGASATGEDPVAERRPIDGRVASVLDARRLFEQAQRFIERSVQGADPQEGVEG